MGTKMTPTQTPSTKTTKAATKTEQANTTSSARADAEKHSQIEAAVPVSMSCPHFANGSLRGPKGTGL